MNSKFDFFKGFILGAVVVFVIYQFFPASQDAGLDQASQDVSQQVEKKVEETASESRVRGSSNPAITIVEHSDFHCPYCRQASATIQKIFEDYEGKVSWSFKHMPLVLVPGAGAFPTHEAAACAEEQGKFWEFHEAVFTRDSAPRKDDLERIAQDLELDLQGFNQCLEENRYAEQIQAEARKGLEQGITGTPTFFVNGVKVVGPRSYHYFAALIDPEYKAPEEPVDTLPRKVDESLDGRPSWGPEDAPIVIEEFSDFHCSFCKRFTGVVDEVLKEEIFQGKVRRVWRHNPLPFHQYAAGIHLGSECAHNQGKFWEYHEKIFADPMAYRVKDDLDKLAVDLGLDAEKFEPCLSDRETIKKIENDLALGYMRRVSGTPTSFINGKGVVGALHKEAFRDLLMEELGLNKTDVPGVKSGDVDSEGGIAESESETEEV